MKQIIEFFKTALIGGFFVLLPLVLIVVMVIELEGIILTIVRPVVELLPVEELGGVEVAEIVAFGIILAACFFIGVATKTAIGKFAGKWFEKLILNKIPGYDMIKGLTSSFAPQSEENAYKPVAIQSAFGTEMIGFAVETFEDGRVVVFVPTAPTPSIGNIHIASSERVRFLDASLGATTNCLMQWGIGAKDVVGKK